MFMLNKDGTLLPPVNILFCKDENMDLHMYYTVNKAVVNYL